MSLRVFRRSSCNRVINLAMAVRRCFGAALEPAVQAGVAARLVKQLAIWIAVALPAGFFPLMLFAGTSGKLAGKITDKETGRPLSGVEVSVRHLERRAVSSENGEYFILNLRPGLYEVQAAREGFGRMIKQEVRVHVDLTARVDFALSSQSLEAVELVAERTLLRKDLTVSATVFAEEELQALPITSYHDAVSLTNGTVSSGNNLHARGGGRGEVAYLLDGLSIEEPQARGFGLNAGRSAFNQVQVITGGFNAEYGNAQSGIILLNTHEGRRKRYSGRASYLLDHLGSGGLGETAAQFDWFEGSLAGPEPLSTYVLPRIGHRLPGDLTIFLQGETQSADAAAFHEDALAELNQKSLIPESSRLRTSEALRNETIFNKLFGLGNKRETVLNNFNTKLVWQFSPNHKLGLSWRGNDDNLHAWSFVLGRDVREIAAAAQRAGISDLIDQDNDGRLDEERLDGVDNDGDGRIDEDARLDDNWYLGDFAWGLDNDRDGRVDEEALNRIDDDGDGRIDEDLQPYDWNGYDNNARYEQHARQLSLSWSHNLGSRTFYEIKLARFHTMSGSLPKLGKDGRSRSSFEELEAWVRDYERIVAQHGFLRLPEFLEPYRGFGTPAERFTDQNGNFRYDAGEPFEDWDGDGLYDLNSSSSNFNSNPIWLFFGSSHPFRGQYLNGSHWIAGRSGFEKNLTTTYTFKLDLTSQLHPRHEIKTGVEASYFDIERRLRQLLGPYDGRGLLGDEYRVFPNWQAVYAQDKMELGRIVINSGVRVERFDQGRRAAMPDTSSPFIPRVTPAETKWSVMPRLAFSAAVTPRDALYFNTGSFQQRPAFNSLFAGLNQPLQSANALLGNPNLDPEKTVQYELGFRRQFGGGALITLTGFLKDHKDVPVENRAFDYVGNTFITYFNRLESAAKGGEVQLTSRFGKYFAGSLSYTVQEVKFTFKQDTSEFFLPLPAFEYAADWDQRHKIVLNADLHFAKHEGPGFGSFYPLENWNLNVLYKFNSGMPYTPEALTGVGLMELTNAKRFPETHEVDVRMRRFFNLASSRRAGLVLEVLNLFNRRNAIGLDEGGVIDAHRDKIGFTNANPSRSRNYGGYGNAAPHPGAWRHGRIVRLGLTAEF